MDRQFKFLCFIILLVLPATALAALEPSCRNGSFPDKSDIALGRIIAKPGERVFFRSFDNGNFAIRARDRGTFLVEGDSVLVARPYGHWICAFHVDGEQTSAGWIARANVMMVPFSATPALHSWVGRWIWPPTITLTIRKIHADALSVDAGAKWYGSIVRSGERDVHFGGVTGAASPHGNLLVVSGGSGPGRCIVHFRLIARYLVANDNGQCGGVNVHVEGVLLRASEVGKRRQPAGG